MSSTFDSLIIYTDGACTGNPGPGGWGAILAFPKGEVKEIGGGNPETTNNRMEIVATLRALAAIEDPTPVLILYTDSTYVIRGITQWIWGWKKKGWKNAEGQDVSNRDLWEELLRQVQRLKPSVVEWKYVRGHSGNPGNERCDEIAVAFANGKSPRLYNGPLIKYTVAVHDLPEDQGLPALKTYDKKPPAFSYLSYYGGTVMRHLTWTDCERRVKGRSQAKFKRAQNQKDEAEILRGWGLDPATTVIEE